MPAPTSTSDAALRARGNNRHELFLRRDLPAERPCPRPRRNRQGQDLTLGFTYNPASQIVSVSSSNDAFAWTAHGNGTTSGTANGLNQLTGWNGALAYDPKGNLVSDGTRSYGYDSENRLTGLPSALRYDALGRLDGAGSPVAQAYENEGDRQIAERNVASGAVTVRHVFGPGQDEPLVTYWGSGTTDRRFLHADERGSIVATTSSAAGLVAIIRYDEYGKPETTSTAGMGRFLYTGQRYLGGPGLYYYKARIYDPKLGRFLQTDPIGYGDGMNIYAYVGGDPVNFTDPLGLKKTGEEEEEEEIVVTGKRPRSAAPVVEGGTFWGSMSSGDIIDTAEDIEEEVIVITGKIDRQKRRGKNFFKQIIKYPQKLLAYSLGLGRKPRPPALLESPCGCFAKGTKVSTPKGMRPIEEIKVGDLVLAQNQETGEIAAKAVLSLITPENKPLYEVRVSGPRDTGSTFRATDDHPWKVEGQGWVETRLLRSGDRIATASGEGLLVGTVKPTQHIARTYNLTVADWHTFMVGDSRAIVHNQNCFTHTFKYDPRVLKRTLEDPKAHGFPYSMDDEILRQPPTMREDGSLTYRLHGFLNRDSGFYEIGLNPSTGTIYHRTFRRD